MGASGVVKASHILIPSTPARLLKFPPAASYNVGSQSEACIISFETRFRIEGLQIQADNRVPPSQSVFLTWNLRKDHSAPKLKKYLTFTVFLHHEVANWIRN